MRKEKKKQIENFVELFSQAHSEMKKTLEAGSEAIVLKLLGQCQESAIKLGNLIESEEGQSFVTVSLLEDYCELIYQIHEAICQDARFDMDEVYDKLQSFLLRISESIKNDIKTNIEAVFLPYKASMWDSLESVWQAADEEPNCNAYVIPIPYYDINSDGSLGKMHYEADLYPDYVPVTAYNAFDFAAHKPDMIFFHYPYDDTNFVTSVHPFFYSKNLKQYTEKLVYIPYFVLGEPDPDDEEAVKDIEHFCKVPGVYNADKVIVQSENMRKIYINVLTELVGERTRPYWEEKILGLGSPKYDKVSSIGEKEFAIPDEWRKVLQKADGSQKTVILYNTSVSAIHQLEERALKKIRNVFRIMKARKEEVALLWRPHPLIQATIESMNPQLWTDYQKLVEEYKAEGWGIYDDSAELDRAIALCDGYYGDYSSLVQLCQKAGKPTMIQNVEVLDEEE